MSHGCHIYAKSYDVAKAKMCAHPQSDHALLYCKCVLRCCAKCPCINIPYQEIDDQYLDTTFQILFYIYHIIARCTAHSGIPLKDKKICRMCKQESSSNESKNLYTLKKI